MSVAERKPCCISICSLTEEEGKELAKKINEIEPNVTIYLTNYHTLEDEILYMKKQSGGGGRG